MTTQRPRIEPLSPKKASLTARLMYRYAKRRFGEVPVPFAVGAHHMPLLVANAVHETLLERGSKKLPANVRELAVYWTARTVGCSWCVDFGAMLIRLDGLDVERLKHIDDVCDVTAFHRRRARRDRLRRRDDDRPAPGHRRAGRRSAARFGDAGAMELTYQIGIENMRARMNTALGITEQGFSSGDACRVPWADERTTLVAQR